MGRDIRMRAAWLVDESPDSPEFAVELGSFVEQLEVALSGQPGAYSVSATDRHWFRLYALVAKKTVSPDKDGYCRIKDAEWEAAGPQWRILDRLLAYWERLGFVGLTNRGLSGDWMFEPLDQRALLEDIAKQVRERLLAMGLVDPYNRRSARGSRPATPFVVEDVFLLHQDGRLILHRGRIGEEGKGDPESVGPMLTAILAFAREAAGSEGPLNEMAYGDSKILIEAARSSMIVVSVFGDPDFALRRLMRDALNAAEVQLGSRLENWDGDRAIASKVGDLFSGIWGSSTQVTRGDVTLYRRSQGH